MAEKPRITSDELTRNLVNARKIMNKVDTGDYEKGNINENILKSDPEELMQSTSASPKSKISGLPVGVPSIDKIRSSRLPDTIKKAMIENPIEQISLNDGLSLDIVNKAIQLMEEDNGSNKRGTGPRQTTEIKKQFQTEATPSNIEVIIENVIRRVLDEKLSQILNAQGGTSLNENLAIKVGDSIFTGKITRVKNTK